MPDELVNVGVALRTYIRESTVLVSAPYLGSANKVTIGWPKNSGSPITAPPYENRIVIYTGRGGPGYIGLGIQRERIDIFCYGIDEAACKSVWRALEAYLFPEQVGVRRQSSFTRNQCQVNQMIREGAPLSLIDNDIGKWPYTVASYMTDYCGVPKV